MNLPKKQATECDLTEEKCPMNLVKFKAFFHSAPKGMQFVARLKGVDGVDKGVDKGVVGGIGVESSGVRNICKFLEYKKSDFSTEETSGGTVLIKFIK